MPVAHVLLIDDSKRDSEMVSEALQDLSQVIVFPVENAVQGFNFLAKQNGFANMPSPDLIVLDMRMPVIDGLHALKVIKDTPNWRNVPIVLLSGTFTEEDRAAAIKLGACDVLKKPLLWVDLEALARELLRHLPLGLRPTNRID